jgi:EAL domain-containing protein (putative c-di-GMP-specific phosphodiesterase class I)/ActR/RegA family two-component response regulator
MQSAIETGSRSVLIVDDDPVFSALAEAVLLDAGCGRVETAAAGGAGIRLALSAKPRPDLIILDLNMPEFDGLAAMRFLADLEFKGSIIIVSGEKPSVLQASGKLANLHGLRLAGILSKPLRAGDLIALVEALPKPSAEAKPVHAGGNGGGLENMLRVVPAYQPKVRLSNRRIYGAEALMRVLLDDGRIAPPLDYLNSLSEVSDLGEATLSFLATILADMRSWDHAGALRPISVNVPAPLLEAGGYMERFAEAVRAADVLTSQITIEMTEAALPKDMSKMVEVMTRLRMAGFGLAIDDYGTGMANYDMLRLCPFTELKIDRSVVQAATHDSLACGFIGNCVSIARALSMAVVAEGVETSEQAEAVRRLGVDVIQGYFFSKPLNAAQYSDLLQSATRGTGG